MINIEIRPSTLSDAEFLFSLRNSSSNRHMFRNSQPIDWSDHLSWFRRKLTDPNFHIYIGEIDGIPIGQFRVSESGDVSVSLADEFKNMGLGSVLIKSASDFHLKSSNGNLIAVIKVVNISSIRAFTKAGYTFIDEKIEGGDQYARYKYE